MFLLEAKEILRREYQNNLLKISSEYQKDFMEEKIRHSYQVLGYGNLLLRGEDCFAELSLEEKDFLQAVVLLHDVGRFYEIIGKMAGEQIDHGVYGAQYLAHLEGFNKEKCFLPIRHHGHLIEKLYEDEDYLSLSTEQQEIVRKVCFLVRDADKLANFYLLFRDFGKIENVFFAAYCFENPYSKKITSEVFHSFMTHTSVKRGEAQNFADMALFFLAWIYDLNFTTSFRFLRKMKVVEKLVSQFAKFWDEQDKLLIEREILLFVQEKCCNNAI